MSQLKMHGLPCNNATEVFPNRPFHARWRESGYLTQFVLIHSISSKGRQDKKIARYGFLASTFEGHNCFILALSESSILISSSPCGKSASFVRFSSCNPNLLCPHPSVSVSPSTWVRPVSRQEMPAGSCSASSMASVLTASSWTVPHNRTLVTTRSTPSSTLGALVVMSPERYMWTWSPLWLVSSPVCVFIFTFLICFFFFYYSSSRSIMCGRVSLHPHSSCR